jgi:hypothetical protein
MEEYRMIDKSDVTGFLSSFLRFVKGIIAYTLSAVRQHMALAVITLVLVLGAGFYFWRAQKSYYEAEMVCTYSNMTKKAYGEMVHNLDLLLQNKSYHALASTLNIPEEQATSIISIEAKNIAGSPLYEDVTTDASPMYFTVKATDRNVFSPLQDALVYYMNHGSPFRQVRDKMELESISNKRNFLHKDMAMVDSIVISYSKFLKRTKSVTDTAAGFSNVATLFTYKNTLEDKDLQQEWRAKELQQAVHVEHGFLTPDNPVSNKKSLLLNVIICALLLPTAICVIYRLLSDTFKKESSMQEPAPVADAGV